MGHSVIYTKDVSHGIRKRHADAFKIKNRAISFS